MSAAPAGWYDDKDPGFVRYWDGRAWTQHVQPKKSAPAGADPVPSAAVEPTTRRAARSAEQAAAPTAAAKQSKPIEKLSKREARERLRAAEAQIEAGEAVVARYQMRAFDDVDAYRIEQESQLGALRAEFEAEQSDARELLVREQSQERERFAAEQAAERLKVEQAVRSGQERVRAAEQQAEEARATRDELNRGIGARRTELVDLTAAVELQAVGLFDFDHPAASSTELASKLEALRYRIKNAVRDKRAVTTAPRFRFNDSEAQGRKFMTDMAKVLLRAYNAEAENAVKATRAGNLHVAQTRLSRAAEQIAKSGTMIDLRIEPSYHQMRLEEIALANEHLQVVQAEKERERERRAELREQQRAAAELQAEHDRLEKERQHYLATLAALEANGDVEGAARVQARLVDVDRAINDVDYRAANVRAGYVYVISNVGAFGERMVKIGMTRRLKPMDRVIELGDASVPFRFDVHALFFADDAVGVETMLHQTFATQRVNKVNLRREFFYVTPAEVLDALKSHAVEVVEYTVEPVAEEFRTSELATDLPASSSAGAAVASAGTFTSN
ncbi:DUF4041 domain-containing protein [Curtobacterium flaccumfaciens]|uniref:DUF4041 domain-containing protein n=1 Tax=Curtobacterium flaccumfaciens TaxID=2035 RepID=UPI00217E5D56|nr:DUF4041 domain-containing protein [Curtobacterium flaccumfaciens]MCS6554792.1 DUF4041 domain-containing protein [Curtobacterium flaccumfaciens]